MNYIYFMLGMALIAINVHFIRKGLKSLKNGGW